MELILILTFNPPLGHAFLIYATQHTENTFLSGYQAQISLPLQVFPSLT